MTVFRGHTENAGHFLQLATMAIGHKVIALLLLSLFELRAEPEIPHERHCGRVGAEVQTNSDHISEQPKKLRSVLLHFQTKCYRVVREPSD